MSWLGVCIISKESKKLDFTGRSLASVIAVVDVSSRKGVTCDRNEPRYFFLLLLGSVRVRVLATTNEI